MDPEDSISMSETVKNKQPIIFLVHSSQDRQIASMVTKSLKEMLIDVLVDFEDVELGENFVKFMVQSMEESDYCVALWSNNVNLKSFIGEEITAAYARSVRGSKNFLILAKVDNRKIPDLFCCRIYIDLSTDFNKAIKDLVALIKRDNQVNISTQKPVIPGPQYRTESLVASPEANEVYICSGVFDRTLTWEITASQRASDLRDDIIKQLDLPPIISYNNRIGLNLHYYLRGPNGRLNNEDLLVKQGVTRLTVIWIEVEAEMFSAGVQVENSHNTNPLFRDSSSYRHKISEREKKEVINYAAGVLSQSLLKSGARSDSALDSHVLEARMIDYT